MTRPSVLTGNSVSHYTLPQASNVFQSALSLESESPTVIGSLFALMSACCFGSSNIFIRRGMRGSRENGVFIATFVNLVIFLTIFFVLYLSHRLPLLTLPGFLFFVFAGLLTSYAGRSFLYAAIRALGPSRAASVRACSPIVTVSWAFLILSERFTPAQFVGATAVVGGIWVLSREILGRSDLEAQSLPISVAGETSQASKRPMAGILYALGAATSFGTGHFLRKLGLIEVPSPIWGVAIGTTAGWLAIVLHTTHQGEIRDLCRNNFNVRIPPWSFIASGLFTSAGQLLAFLSVYFTAVSITAVLMSSEPLATLVISRLFLGGEERLNWRVTLCSGVVFAGIVLMFV